MSNDIEREAFEVEIKRIGGFSLEQSADGEYRMPNTFAAWKVWQAARAQQGEVGPVAWVTPLAYGQQVTFYKPQIPEGFNDNELGIKWYCRPLVYADTRPPTGFAGEVPEARTARDFYESGDYLLSQDLDACVQQAEGWNKCRRALLAAAPSPEQPKPTNRYGVDAPYFHGKLSLVLRDLENYTPDELARSLARLVVVADKNVLAEPEFTPEQSQAAPGSEQLTWALDEDAAGALRDFIGDDTCPQEVTLSVGEVRDESSETILYGLRCWSSDYPEEGAILLSEMANPNPPAEDE